MTITSSPPSPEANLMLRALREAVTKNLERKKRLGQYAVVWQNDGPVQTGEDAPKAERK